jgi:GT2 family glycosyltransferase
MGLKSRTGIGAKVSVVLAVYNGVATLAECLDSLRQIDYPRHQLEVLCVDNGSTDDTPRILKDHRDYCTILREPKRGPAAARNAGVRCASGDIVALTDADCRVDADWLRHLVEPLRDPGVGVAGGAIFSKRPCNAIEAFGERIHDHYRALHEFVPAYAITMNWAARRDVIDAVGLFNENLLRCSDVDWSYRMLRRGYRAVYAPSAIVYHQNERTPWGLMHEGYVHGYHAVNVLRLHSAFVEQARRARPARRVTPHAATRSQQESAASRPWSDALWLRMFRLGKNVGRLHAGLSVRRQMLSEGYS